MSDPGISQTLRPTCPVCHAPRLDSSRLTCSDQCEVFFQEALDRARGKLGPAVSRVQRCVLMGGEFDGDARLVRDETKRLELPHISLGALRYVRMTVCGQPTRLFAHEALAPADVFERLVGAYERK